MNKGKPEVGDVWVTADEDVKVRVMYTFIHEEVLYVAVLIAQLTLDGKWVYFSEVLKEPTFEDCTYLGKSKVSIKELFDVVVSDTVNGTVNDIVKEERNEC